MRSFFSRARHSLVSAFISCSLNVGGMSCISRPLWERLVTPEREAERKIQISRSERLGREPGLSHTDQHCSLNNESHQARHGDCFGVPAV